MWPSRRAAASAKRSSAPILGHVQPLGLDLGDGRACRSVDSRLEALVASSGEQDRGQPSSRERAQDGSRYVGAPPITTTLWGMPVTSFIAARRLLGQRRAASPRRSPGRTRELHQDRPAPAPRPTPRYRGYMKRRSSGLQPAVFGQIRPGHPPLRRLRQARRESTAQAPSRAGRRGRGSSPRSGRRDAPCRPGRNASTRRGTRPPVPSSASRARGGRHPRSRRGRRTGTG